MNFKDYNQRQTALFPYSFDDLIPTSHPVRVVDQLVEQLNLQGLIKTYKKKKAIRVITQKCYSK
jgi:transposase